MNRYREPRGRRGYHHGNLREALIQAALQLIADNGPEGVTLSEAARMAGVSPAAPYRHFRDRGTLIAAVAQQGFAHFADALDAAWDDGEGHARAGPRPDRSRLPGVRPEEPAYFAAMFEPSGTETDAETAREGDRAFGVLRDAAAAIHAILPAERRAPPLMIALHVWSLAHGISSLFLRGDTARRTLPVSPEDLLESGILIYLDGLGLNQPKAQTTA